MLGCRRRRTAAFYRLEPKRLEEFRISLFLILFLALTARLTLEGARITVWSQVTASSWPRLNILGGEWSGDIKSEAGAQKGEWTLRTSECDGRRCIDGVFSARIPLHHPDALMSFAKSQIRLLGFVPVERAADDRSRMIWDSQHHSASEGYAFFRDAMRTGGLPWTARQMDEELFRARNERIALKNGHIGRLRCVSTEYVRTTSDVVRSDNEYYCGFYVLSGSMNIDQGSSRCIAQRGDLAFIDDSAPAKVTALASGNRTLADMMGIMLPKRLFGGLDRPEKYFTSAHYPGERLPAPLCSLLSYLAHRLIAAPYDELDGTFEAVVRLVPVGVGAYAEKGSRRSPSTRSASMRSLMDLIEDQLKNPDLTALSAARQLNLSESYVHRLFSESETTFGLYVTNKRLDYVRADLMFSKGPACAISVLAYKWGFNDLSTFNRAFKKRFGCTPRELKRVAE